VSAPTGGRGIFPDELLRTCISCGFCLSACPTYQDTRRESSSPRGRINLMRALERGELDSIDVRGELSFCLGCRACEPVCPAGVRYGALLEYGRDAVGMEDPGPVLPGLLWGVASPRRTRLVGAAMRAGQVLGLTRIAPTRTLRATGAAAPRIEPDRRRRMPEAAGPEAGEPCALFLGCVGHVMFSPAARAAVAALAAAGYRVTVPRAQGCCGALHAHNGELDDARELAAAFIESFRGHDGPIVTTAGGCGAFMSDYGHLLATEEAAAFAGRVRDVSQLLWGRELPLRADAPPLRVAYQDSCHLRNGQRVSAEPRALLRALPGVELVDLPLAARCCGAAGTYALLRPADSRAFLAPKLAEIAAAGVDAIVSGNPGCLLQFRQGVRDAGLGGVQVLHTAEVVASRLAVDSAPARSSSP
jgi:glycolate oxidase iron-sulfur subunit